MLKVYGYLFSTLVLCLGISAWLINSHLGDTAIASDAELALARGMLQAPNPQASHLISAITLTDIHFDPHIDEQLRSGAVVPMLDQDNQLLFYYLDGSRQRILVLGPLPRAQREQQQALISLLFYTSVAVAVLLVCWPLFRDLTRLRQASNKISVGNFAAQARLGRLSAIKRIGDAFDEMAEELQNQSDYQRQLINAVSHDFFTPISRAKFALEMAAHQPSGAVDCNSVLQDITELEMLVEEFLTYAELNQCKPVIRPVVHDARELLEQGCDKFRIYSDLNIHIDCHCDVIEVDRRSFLRILTNLMSNAVRFAHTQIHISLRAHPHGIELSVADDGPGFNEQLSGKLLQAFVKNHQVAQREQTGVGLGLSIVSKLCLWHDADLQLEQSTALNGACVRIVF
ncbi:ATP-binding protein [Pseudoalteromonas sp. T1lg88]|uniref:ATP-binding protein n=1 Tax=Pseudoalteromonas sp. T1lg88 TaxID=2077104 RepID=UPI000CF5EDF6|nr:ATP-binding protein [Pseudoalteromonas sp. T1lg88]